MATTAAAWLTVPGPRPHKSADKAARAFVARQLRNSPIRPPQSRKDRIKATKTGKI